ncbi:MAG: hypothetical protein ACAI43_22435 [Phycisphaerae bacterium]
MIGRIFLAAALTAVLAGCKPPGPQKTSEQVIAEYRPKFDAFRATLRDIAAVVDKAPAPTAAAPAAPVKLDPRPVSVTDEAKSNTAVMPYEQLLDTDAADPLDLLGGILFKSSLAWTGPKNPMNAEAMKKPADGMAAQFDRALAVRYVLVYRKTAKPTEVDLFLVDIPTKRVAASVRATIDPVVAPLGLQQAIKRAVDGDLEIL